MTSEVLISTPNSLVLASDGAVTVKGKKAYDIKIGEAYGL